ncbi:hypothetical protein JYQ62_28235 [Nostoc sp. UHCC 0702]|nr:hypothetical protein JYQ62_28235 [Nostoc sp. UHCC 0702]
MGLFHNLKVSSYYRNCKSQNIQDAWQFVIQNLRLHESDRSLQILLRIQAIATLHFHMICKTISFSQSQ